MDLRVQLSPGVAIDHIPFEFLFVFVFREIMTKHKITLQDICITSITFPQGTRLLENGDDYDQAKHKPVVWISSDLNTQAYESNNDFSDEELIALAVKNYFSAKIKTFNRINNLQLSARESVFELFQTIILKYTISGVEGEQKEWISVPVGYCVAKKPSGF